MTAQPRLRVVLLGYADAGGGAARATQRLHQAFRAQGLDSLHLVFRRLTTDPDTLQLGIDPATAGLALRRGCRAVQDHLSGRARSGLSDTYLSFPYPGVDLAPHPALRRADVIHLNWPGPGVSPRTVAGLAGLGVPLVWTLHDEAAYTGGCHYTAGCRGFERACRHCPQLKGAARGVPALVLEDKLELWQRCPLHLVTPSRWLAGRVAASRLFRDRPRHHIPNALPARPFIARPMEHCRRRLALPDDAPLVLCVAEDLDAKRKGFTLLADAMARLGASARPGTAPVLVTVGRRPATGPPARTLHLGRIDDDFELATVYSAMDVVAVPSLEDNFPNAALEALGCGVPVVGFRRGGLPELVDDRARGVLVEEATPQALAAGLAEALTTRPVLAERRRIAAIVHEQFSPERTAAAYATVFRAAARERSRGLAAWLRGRRNRPCPQFDQLGPATADLARLLITGGIDQRPE